MSGANLYYDLAGILTAAGCRVQVGPINAGWEHRARSSGGFPVPPLATFWHHTASSTSVESDLSWMIDGCDDAPVGNLLLDRDGVFWPIAGGASNCAGKGGPATFSRGTIAVDSGNTGGFQIEVANGGTGEPWPQAQIDAYIAGSNALGAHVGNQPGDVITHHVWAPTRKIDPATADAVQGPWRPAASTSSGTWSLDDIAAECGRRAGQAPSPRPPTPIGDDMATVIKGDETDSYYAWNGVTISGIPGLDWVRWGFEAGLYPSQDPVTYPQSLINDLLDAQGER